MDLLNCFYSDQLTLTCRIVLTCAVYSLYCSLKSTSRLKIIPDAILSLNDFTKLLILRKFLVRKMRKIKKIASHFLVSCLA